MKKTTIIFNLLASLLFTLKVAGQNSNADLPQVGKPMPDFLLNDVQNYRKKQVSLSDFKGKWLILDFWNQYCGICLESMPKMDALQKQFSGKAQILLVGYTGSQYRHISNDSTIRQLYERTRKDYNLSLAIAYDSLLMHQYRIKPTPYIITVDPKGIVRAITSRMNADGLRELMAGKASSLKKAYHSREEAAKARLEQQAAMK